VRPAGIEMDSFWGKRGTNREVESGSGCCRVNGRCRRERCRGRSLQSE